MIATLVLILILGICFGGGHLMNPTNDTEYSYKPEELWEEPIYWNTFERNVVQLVVATTFKNATHGVLKRV